MATHRWLGQTVAVAQVWTGSIDSLDATPANNTFTVTIGGVAISVAGTVDVATTATALRAALNASTHPYFSTITWSGASGSIIGTADSAGVPFTAALTETGAGTGAVTDFAVTTANASPNALAAGNFDSGALPSNGDTIIFENSTVSVLWLLDAMTAVTTLTIIRYPTYTGRIGLDKRVFQATASTTTAAAKEYREDELTIDGATLFWMPKRSGRAAAATSQRVIVNFKTSAATVLIEETATSASESNLEPVRLKGSHASNVATITGASIVGFATNDPADTAQFDISAAGRATVHGTDQLTCGVLTLRESPVVRLAKAPTTIDGKDENCGAILTTAMTSGTVTTATIGEKMTWKHVGGAITGTTINHYGTIDLTGARGNVTGTAWNVLASGAKLIDPFNRTPANQDFVFGGAVSPEGFFAMAGGRTLRKTA